MAPVRTLVVWCPDWPVVAAGVSADTPAVVLFANRVVAASPAARAEDIHQGLRKREAQARCPQVTVLERDELRDARAFEPVLVAVEAFTPRIELTAPGACAFPTHGPSRYFGGDDALAQGVRSAVVEVLGGRSGAEEARVQVGVADGPFAARLAACRRSARLEPVVVPPGSSASFLAPLPVRVLDRPDLTDVLERLGLRTLGAFAELDAADVVGRFGAEGEAAHRLARGLDERPPDTRRPPPDLRVSTELDPPADRIEPVAFAGRVLADELVERLGGMGLACTRVLITAETEHGETCERVWRDEGTLDAGAITDRIRWQLDQAERLTAGIVFVALLPDEVVPATGRQLGFWGGETESAERAARALARVEGLLGSEAVRVPEWRGGRGPSDRITLVPAGAVDLTGDRPAADPRWIDDPWPGRVPDPAPATVYPEPMLVEVLDAEQLPVSVDGRGSLSAPPAELVLRGSPARRVVAWAGPWLFDERWWDGDRHRRRARFQLVTDDGVARLLTIEQHHWWIEAVYD